MGHHINEKGNFQSDKYPDLSENKIILSFNDPAARQALHHFAIYTKDMELADDILRVLKKYSKVQEAIAQAIGWAYADCCVTLDQGGDPRQTNMNDVLERAKKDLG